MCSIFWVRFYEKNKIKLWDSCFLIKMKYYYRVIIKLKRVQEKVETKLTKILCTGTNIISATDS